MIKLCARLILHILHYYIYYYHTFVYQWFIRKNAVDH